MSRTKEKDRERWLAAVGKANRKYRTDAGLSQEALGYKAGLHRTYVSDVERGRRNPTAWTLFQLARTLGVTPSAIFRTAEEVLEEH